VTAPSNREIIQRLRAAGFIMFPCRGKVPSRRGVNWRETKLDTYSDDELAYENYAVAFKKDQMAIDIDPRNFGAVRPDGQIIPRFHKMPSGELVPNKEAEGLPTDNPLKRLLNDAGIGAEVFKPTFRVKTGGDGLHIYVTVAVPEGMEIADTDKYPGINFQRHGKYTVGPGSIHPDTRKTYTVLGGDPAHLVAAPDSLLKIILRPIAKSFSSVGTGAYKDDAATQDRFAAYLLSAPPSIQGQNGNANAFKVAACGRDFALPPETTWRLMTEGEWNKKCAPPWSADELHSVVEHAYKYARGAVGNSHPEADFRGVEMPPLSAEPVNVDTPVPSVESEGSSPTTADLEVFAAKDPANDGINWTLSKQGSPTRCFHNLLNYTRFSDAGMQGVFGYNEFCMQAEFTGIAPWHGGKPPAHPSVSDNDLKMLKAHLASNHGFEKSVSEIEEAVVVTAKRNAFHPVRDYLRSLEWDGTQRLETWLHDYLGVEDNKYSRAVARKTLCAGVMRVFFPGCKFDHVLILEGAQDLGKSSVCEILGGKWSGDFPIDPHNKDTVQLLQGRWVVELAELEVTGRTETDALKAFLTRRSDRIRLAYGRLPIEFPRQSVFIASKNPNADGTYLKDDTGNRRWWPVMCAPKGGQVDFKAFQAVRDQLWAEAVVRVRDTREALFMETAELKDLAKLEVAKRHAPHPWTERLGTWIEGLTTPRDFLTAREVFIDALGGIDKQMDRRATVGIAQALRGLGWAPADSAVGGRPTRGFKPILGKAVLPKITAAGGVTAESVEDELGLGEL
jgi:predicted P-loop ATPase